MSSISEWQWDAARQTYFHWNPEEQCYILQDGTRLSILQDGTRLSKTGHTATSNSKHPRLPGSAIQERDLSGPDLLRNEGRNNENIAVNLQDEARTASFDHANYRLEREVSSLKLSPETRSSGYGLDSRNTDGSSSSTAATSLLQSGHNPVLQQLAPNGPTANPAGYWLQPGYEPFDYGQSGCGQLGNGQPSYESQRTSAMVPSAQMAKSAYELKRSSIREREGLYNLDSQTDYGLTMELERAAELEVEGDVTDKELYKQGVRARGMIKGTRGRIEKLDSDYHVQNQGAKFFKVGKVFKILWAELPSNNIEGMTIVSDVRFARETIFTKIRWFVVIKEGIGCCTCVPISTYQGRGCIKPELAKWQHCIVYTGSNEPEPLKEEEPTADELPMLSSIRVRQRDQREKLFPASRINFGKLYTVEHNVKVYNFGDVHRDSMQTLKSQWRWVLDCDLSSKSPNLTSARAVISRFEREKHERYRKSKEEMEEDEEDKKKEEKEQEEQEKQEEVDLPYDATALWPWSANNQGQLAFKAGDTITITEWADENWGRGKNTRTGREGVFARNYVSMKK